MHDLCMATKTISLRIEANAKLARARRYPDESFSEVVLWASWPDETVSGAELLQRYRDHGPSMSEEVVARIEQLKSDDLPPENKWADN
jgi:predicted CopG family antitoxin